MKTVKKFRAWKNNRLIPYAIPLDDTHIIVGARLLNGIPTLKINEVDCIEQLLNEGFYEGDVIAFLDRFDFSINVGLPTINVIDTDEGPYLAECFEKEFKTNIDADDINQDILDSPLLLGNIHEKALSDKNYWISTLNSKLETERKKYD